MKRVDEVIKLTTLHLNVPHQHASTDDSQADPIQHKILKQYGTVIQTPRHGTISTILNPETYCFINQ